MKTTRLECVPEFHVFRFEGSPRRWLRILTGCVSIEDEPILQTTYAEKDSSVFPQYEAAVIDLGPVEFAEPKPLPRIDRCPKSESWLVYSERHPDGREPMVGDEFILPRGKYVSFNRSHLSKESWAIRWEMKSGQWGEDVHPADLTIHRLADDPQPFVEPTVEELKRFAEAGWKWYRHPGDTADWRARSHETATHYCNTYEEAITYIRQKMQDSTTL